MSRLSAERCVACHRDSPRVTEAEIARLRREIPDWSLVERDGITRLDRVFHFPSFAGAVAFTNRVAALAEEEGHHPALLTEWGRVTVTCRTHAIRGLHRNDFIMAAKTDALSEPPREEGGLPTMVQMPNANLLDVARGLVETGKQVTVLWQEDESLAFVAKGRDYRSEFHINPSAELMYQIQGTMHLHYRTREGAEDVAVLKEGSVIYTPAGAVRRSRLPRGSCVPGPPELLRERAGAHLQTLRRGDAEARGPVATVPFARTGSDDARPLGSRRGDHHIADGDIAVSRRLDRAISSDRRGI